MKKKVVKHPEQVKLFLEPELLEQGFDIELLLRELRLDVEAMATSAGVALMQNMINSEIKSLVGERYSREGEYYPWGKQKGYVMASGQKVPVEYTRVRKNKAEEVRLKSYDRFQQDDARTRGVFARMLASVSCRDYPKAIETMRQGYGISKSAVNREMIQATREQWQQLTERSLAQVNLAVLIIDGIRLTDTVFIGALGVDTRGVKHFLGVIEGATEGADACVSLLENLKERGLSMDGAVLAVLDGSKALCEAVKRFFQRRVVIQRCQEHKIRNVKRYLPQKYHAEVDRKLRSAYGMRSYEDAHEALLALVRHVDQLSSSAAGSLREGLEETLTVHRLGLPDTLRETFSSTNTIESTYSRARHLMRNVTRWRNSQQKARWMATVLLQAERSFRKIKGHRLMPILTNAVEAFVQQNTTKAA